MSEKERKTYNQRKILDNHLCRARKGETVHFIYNLYIIICNLAFNVVLVANRTVNISTISTPRNSLHLC